MARRLGSMTAVLAVGVTAAVAAAFAAGAWVFSVRHSATLLDAARTTAVSQGELIRAGLEHQMVENDRSLIARMIDTFGREPGVASVVLLDREGHVRYSSPRLPAGSDLRPGSPTCQACHALPPEQRTASRVIETKDGELLRTMIPIRNREACHRCHDPARRINGVLLVDVSTGTMRATMNRDLRWMVFGSGGMTLLLVLAVVGLVRLVVVRRLQRFETTARLIAAGDLARRVPASGSDTLSWLAREFNTMADAMTGLVGEVRQQNERLESVINSIDDGIVVLDAQRRVMAANRAFLQRTGQKRDDVLGCSCRQVASSACGSADCPTRACLADGQRQVRLCQRPGPNGTVAWEEVHASPMRDASGKVTHVVEVWRDISERRAAEARLAESHRLASLGLLASGFSHELNTPLATVLLCVEGILRDAPEGRVAESAGIAREQVLRCRGITQHFLRLSRGQDGPVRALELAPLLGEVARLLEPTAKEHGIALDVGADGVPVMVRANDAELQHVLINLVLNAIQASRAGDRVSIGIVPGDPARVRVADRGTGMTAEQRARVFEPFTSFREGGTGLGLFLSLNFVRRWGGDITVTSAPGEGSTFDVVLPVPGGAVLAPGAGRFALPAAGPNTEANA